MKRYLYTGIGALIKSLLVAVFPTMMDSRFTIYSVLDRLTGMSAWQCETCVRCVTFTLGQSVNSPES